MSSDHNGAKLRTSSHISQMLTFLLVAGPDQIPMSLLSLQNETSMRGNDKVMFEGLTATHTNKSQVIFTGRKILHSFSTKEGYWRELH